MNLDIRGRNISLTDGLRSHIERRLGFALGRFGSAVGPVLVRFGDENGPRGGEDKSLTCVVRLGDTEVVIEETNADLYAAIDRAADRLSHAVARRLARRRDLRQAAPAQ